eukprot:m.79628 g.79628  ORF g.79628 m.79628 type:complete len:122 (+) comp14167_c0_seq1:1307-1672(+)
MPRFKITPRQRKAISQLALFKQTTYVLCMCVCLYICICALVCMSVYPSVSVCFFFFVCLFFVDLYVSVSVSVFAWHIMPLSWFCFLPLSVVSIISSMRFVHIHSSNIFCVFLFVEIAFPCL